MSVELKVVTVPDVPFPVVHPWQFHRHPPPPPAPLRVISMEEYPTGTFHEKVQAVVHVCVTGATDLDAPQAAAQQVHETVEPAAGKAMEAGLWTPSAQNVSDKNHVDENA